MKKAILEQMLYDCQIGMYFDGVKKLSNGFVVYSELKFKIYQKQAGREPKYIKAG